MSLLMFIIGFILYSIYIVFLIWNINYNSKKQKEENYPELDINKEK